MAKLGPKFKYNRKELIDLYEQGLNDYKIAKILKCHVTVPLKWRKENNLPSHFVQKSSPAVPKVDHYHFPYRTFLETVKQAVVDSGVAIHTPEGRKWLVWASRRFENDFRGEWAR
jgi:hypothetical protein